MRYLALAMVLCACMQSPTGSDPSGPPGPPTPPVARAYALPAGLYEIDEGNPDHPDRYQMELDSARLSYTIYNPRFLYTYLGGDCAVFRCSGIADVDSLGAITLRGYACEERGNCVDSASSIWKPARTPVMWTRMRNATSKSVELYAPATEKAAASWVYWPKL